jgi:four helix bundle protein
VTDVTDPVAVILVEFRRSGTMHGTYEDLKVWRRAMDLVLEVYRCTSSFPKHEMYGITSQMRRAAVSVPSNIAEGKGRFSRKELLQFLFHARGSLLELQTQITIACELGYLPLADRTKLTDLASEVGRLLNGLVDRFQSPIEPRPPVFDAEILRPKT